MSFFTTYYFSMLIVPKRAFGNKTLHKYSIFSFFTRTKSQLLVKVFSRWFFLIVRIFWYKAMICSTYDNCTLNTFSLCFVFYIYIPNDKFRNSTVIELYNESFQFFRISLLTFLLLIFVKWFVIFVWVTIAFCVFKII